MKSVHDCASKAAVIRGALRTHGWRDTVDAAGEERWIPHDVKATMFSFSDAIVNSVAVSVHPYAGAVLRAERKRNDQA